MEKRAGIEDTLRSRDFNQDNHKENIHRDPFKSMKIGDNSFLDGIDGRSPCMKCYKSRKFFCYTCYVPTESLATRLPKVKVNIALIINIVAN